MKKKIATVHAMSLLKSQIIIFLSIIVQVISDCQGKDKTIY